MPKLLHFISTRKGHESDEYVVILTEGEPSDHALPNFELALSIDLPDSDELSLLPTDRPLSER